MLWKREKEILCTVTVFDLDICQSIMCQSKSIERLS